jgi:uracil-DNA glycosylase
VLLLNSILTVRVNEPGSHKEHGWEAFTDAVLELLNARSTPVGFALWGNAARRKAQLLNEDRHIVLTAEHPELSAEKFLGSRPFSAINSALELRGLSGVTWQLPYV